MRADRLLQLLHLLQRHGRLPAPRLAELLEVSERTVLRDMQALSTAGVPVRTEPGRGGGCVLKEGWTTDVSGLTAAEAQAVFAWTSGAGASDLGLGAALGTALTKLAATVPAPALAEADALSSVVVVDRRRWFEAVEEVPLLPRLREAAVARRRVRLRYASAGSTGPRTRTVDPYGLVENAGRWYLLAAHRGQGRSYRVSRIAAATVLDAPARVPDDLDLAAEWDRRRASFERGQAGVEVVYAVEPSVLRLFRQVVRSQAATGTQVRDAGSEPGGWPRVAVTMRARQAAIAVALGFGGQVRLDEPADLRDELVERARRAIRLHRA